MVQLQRNSLKTLSSEMLHYYDDMRTCALFDLPQDQPELARGSIIHFSSVTPLFGGLAISVEAHHNKPC